MRIRIAAAAIAGLLIGGSARAAYIPGPLPAIFTGGDIPVQQSFFSGERDLRASARKLKRDLVNCYRTAVTQLVNGENLEPQLTSCKASKRANYDEDLAMNSFVPPCLNGSTIGDLVEARVQTLNAGLYCDGSTPLPPSFGGGFQPPDVPTRMGETGIAVRARNFFYDVYRCYRTGADRFSKGKADSVAVCITNPRNGAFAKWDQSVAALYGNNSVTIPACINSSQISLALYLEEQIDNAVFYCTP